MKFCYFLLSILLLFPLELKAHEVGENQDAPTPEQQKRWQERNDPARHADCVYSGALCDGDSVYLQKGGKISYKLVEKVTGEKTVDIEFKPYPLKDVATVGRSRCAKKPDGVSLCPGDRVQKGKEFGLVLGVFPDEKVVYATKGKPPERVSASALNPFRYGDLSKDELRNMVYGMGELNEALKLPKKAGCDDVPKPIEAEPNSAQGAGCEEKFGPISANDSPEKKHFAELLEKGLDASLEEFLHLWYPDRGEKDVESPFFECEKYEGGFLDYDKDGQVPEKCHPETLYSWGPFMKLDSLRKNYPDGKDWSGKGNPDSNFGQGVIFTTTSPVATYGYGPMLVRLKIKKRAPFMVREWEKEKNAVAVRPDGFHDFTITNGKQIESWSFGSPEIYDEVVRDILRFRSNKRVSKYRDPSLSGSDIFPQGDIRRLYLQKADYNRQDEESLKANLLEMIREILMGEGRIYYSKGACRSRSLTFSAEKPTYFNPVRAPKP